MTKVLLTGAAGTLGSAVYRQLLADGFEVLATDQSRDLSLPGPIKVANLLDREVCYDLVDGMDVVVHLANHPNAHFGTAQKVFNENVMMNMNVFQAAAESGVKKVVYASSVQAISGIRSQQNNLPSSIPYLPMDGDTPQNPGNAYALSKCVAETQLQYFIKWQKFRSALAIRFPLLLTHEWMADWRARGDRPLPRRFRGGLMLDEGQTWLCVDDGARLVSAYLKADLEGYRCYFPSHPRPRSGATVREVIETFFPGVELRKPIEQIDAIVDISRITRETGWTPIYDYMDEKK